MKTLKKSVLIPVSKLEQLKSMFQQQSNNIGTDPNLKKASSFKQKMQHIMNLPLDDYSKVQLYLPVIKEFMLFRDKYLASKRQPQLVRIVNKDGETQLVQAPQQHQSKQQLLQQQQMPQQQQQQEQQQQEQEQEGDLSKSFYEDVPSVHQSSMVEEPADVEETDLPITDTSVEFLPPIAPAEATVAGPASSIKNGQKYDTIDSILTGLTGVWKDRAKELLSDLEGRENFKWDINTGEVSIGSSRNVGNIKDLIHYEVQKKRKAFKEKSQPSGYQTFKLFLKQNQISPDKSSRPTGKRLQISEEESENKGSGGILIPLKQRKLGDKNRFPLLYEPY
jgi:hypothetical protein